MAISAAFSIEGTSVPTATGAAVEVDYGDTVDLALLSTTGAVSIDWSIVGSSDPAMATPTITKAGSPLGSTASFVFPATVIGNAGAAYGIECEVTDGNGDKATAYGIVGVPSAAGVVPFVAGERAWRHATHGWMPGLNAIAGIVALCSPIVSKALLQAAGYGTGAAHYLLGRLTPGDGGEGTFRWDSSDLSAMVTADPLGGVYVPPTSDATGASGAWVRQWSGAVQVGWWGANPAAAGAANTAGVQAAIDFVQTLGGGEVRVPAGTFALAASTLAETLYNAGASVSTADGCLVLRSGVRLVGTGVGATVLRPATVGLTCIFVSDGTDSAVENLEIYGQGSTGGAGHGIFCALSANDNDTVITGMKFRSLYIHDVCSYGIGVQNGALRDVLIDSVRIYNVGADGIDYKNRDSAYFAPGMMLSNIYVDTFGRRLDGQAGVDIRGIVTASNITVVNMGRSAVEQSGIRFRTASASADYSGRRSSLHGFYVKGDAALTCYSVVVGCADVAISGGSTEDSAYGVLVSGNATATADNLTVVGVTVHRAATRGFSVGADNNRCSFVGCTAVDCAVGFRDEGNSTHLIGCNAVVCDTSLSTAVAAAASQVISGGTLGEDGLTIHSAGAGRADLTAVGASSNISVAITPKGTGTVRFGTHSAIVAETLSGYITITDKDGNARKIGVVS